MNGVSGDVSPQMNVLFISTITIAIAAPRFLVHAQLVSEHIFLPYLSGSGKNDHTVYDRFKSGFT